MKLDTFTLLNRINLRQRTFMVRQIGVMISSGVPIVNTLNLAAQQTENPLLRTKIREMVTSVEGGRSFSEAASEHPDLFDPVMVAMIRSAEASGNLQEIMNNMAEQLERDITFTNKVRNALLYPIFIFAVMIMVGIIMATVVIPKLTSVFDDTELQLPLATRILVAISNTIVHQWYLIIMGLGAAIFLIRSYLQTEAGHAAYYRFQIRIPVLRNLVQGSYLVRFTRMLGMLIRSGVPITEALKLVSGSLSNRLFVRALQSVQEEVERGIPLSTALSRHDVFPKPMTQMIAVGEQTGKLEDVLSNLSKSYEEQTNTAVSAITALIEPVVLLIVALMAGFVVVAVILPIYGLAEQF